jgi:hypothetical protein
MKRENVMRFYFTERQRYHKFDWQMLLAKQRRSASLIAAVAAVLLQGGALHAGVLVLG